MRILLALGATLLVSCSTTSSWERPDDLIVDADLGPYFTIQSAVDDAEPGVTIRVRPGVYHEAVELGTSGSRGREITLVGEGAILDGTGLSADAMILLYDVSYVTVEGFEVRNLAAVSEDHTPMGISVGGAGTGVTVRNNRVHHITTGYEEGNAHGIAVYGDSPQGLSQVTIEGNEVFDCRLGWSEAVVVNGNVDGFQVVDNHIHDVDNIGIDVIGGEGTAPANDQARNGLVARNRVMRVSSAANPAYGGEKAAGGIYVDGGASLVIEGNTVEDCDIGIELASENPGWYTQDIEVRGNTISGSHQGNLQMGGYDEERGGARRLVFEGNTTRESETAEVVFQWAVSNVVLRENTFSALAARPYLLSTGGPVTDLTLTGNTFQGGIAGTDRLD